MNNDINKTNYKTGDLTYAEMNNEEQSAEKQHYFFNTFIHFQKSFFVFRFLKMLIRNKIY